MAEVKWIRINVDMFNNRKVRYLRTLPEGNNIVLIWVMLLTMAGRCNAGGMIFLTENIPYTVKSLADELGYSSNVVQVALAALEKLGMVSLDEDTLTIPGWEDHQNSAGLEKIRNDTRRRTQEYRKRITAANCDASQGVTVTQQNKKENKKENIENTLGGQDKPATARRFQKPTLEEVTAYCSGRHNGIDPQRFIDYYEANGWMVGKTHMKDWQAAVRNWERRDGKSAAPERRKTAEDIYG